MPSAGSTLTIPLYFVKELPDNPKKRHSLRLIIRNRPLRSSTFAALPRRFASENSRLSAAELQPTQAIPGSQRPLFALGGLYPIFVEWDSCLAPNKPRYFIKMKQKQSQNSQIIDRESRSLAAAPDFWTAG
jgi:hypothetical protein